MDARAEQASLRADPLPQVALPQVVIIDPLRRVYEIDGSIASFEARIAELQEEREAALKYAISNNITEDAICKLNVERSVRKSRTLNVDRFREVFPDAHALAIAIERKGIEEKLAHVGETIPLGVVDKLIPKANLMAAQGVIVVKETESLSYSVVRK